MAAYWIANVEVTDETAYAEYAKRAGAIIEAHGGVILARGGRHVQLEGRDRARNVVARFPDVEAGVACYNSPEYTEARSFAKNASIRDMVVVEGVE